MLKLAESFCSNGVRDQHAIDVDHWMMTVRSRFEQFSLRLAEYESLLFTATGRKSDVNRAVNFFYYIQ